jgi:hypothetical protein
MMCPRIAKMVMPKASGGFVKADKRPPNKEGQIDVVELLDLTVQNGWSVRG